MVSNLELKETNVLKSFLVLHFTSSKLALENLDFLIKKSQLIVSSNQLSSEDISFIDDSLVILLELFNLFIGLLNNVGQLLDFVV